MKKITGEKIIENLKMCPSFDKCSKNLCPLDFNLHLRTGGENDKCKWMREPQKKEINGREFISGGHAMPDNLLNIVPKDAPGNNLRWLNKASKKRFNQIKGS